MRAHSLTTLLAVSLLPAAMCPAQVLYDSSGFELPRFVVQNPLEGQDVLNPWQKSSGSSTAVVQTNEATGGIPQLQSVLVTRTADTAGDTRWWTSTPAASSGIVQVDLDLNVNIAAVLTEGPHFGIQAFDLSSGTEKQIGGVFLDAAQGRVHYSDADSGALSPTSRFLSRNEYHHFTLAFDLDRDQYSVIIDGTHLLTESFASAGITTFSYAAISVLAGDTQLQTGEAYFDNFAITQVPEPSCGLAVAAAAGLSMRRRRFS